MSSPETIYTQITKMDSTGCAYTFLYTYVCKINTQKKRACQLETWDRLEGGQLEGAGGRKGGSEEIIFY